MAAVGGMALAHTSHCTIVSKEIGNFLRKQGLGDADALGRLNMAAASAALAD